MQTATQSELSRADHGRRQEFLTGPQVQARYQRSHVTLWRWIRDHEMRFPQPLKINRLNYWRLADLERWENAQAEKTAE